METVGGREIDIGVGETDGGDVDGWGDRENSSME